jgi:hypothetical protein
MTNNCAPKNSDSSESDIDSNIAAKKSAEVPAVGKNKGDLNKRLAGGFFFLSWYVLSYHSGIFYQAIFFIVLLKGVLGEITSAYRDDGRD